MNLNYQSTLRLASDTHSLIVNALTWVIVLGHVLTLFLRRGGNFKARGECLKIPVSLLHAWRAVRSLDMETQRRVEPNRGNSGYTLECNGRFDRVAGG